MSSSAAPTDQEKDALAKLSAMFARNPSLLLLATKKLSTYLRQKHPDFPKLSDSKLSELLKKVEAAAPHLDAREQLHARPPKVKKFYRLDSPLYSLQIDVMFLKAYKRQNSGFDRALVAVDQLSRKAFVVPMKGSSMTLDILPAYEKIEHEMAPVIPSVVKGDDEFNASAFRNYCESRGTTVNTVVSADEHITKGAGNPLGLVDRFIRTFRSLVTHSALAKNDVKWVSDLPDILEAYNHMTPHSSLPDGKTPQDVYDDTKDLLAMRHDDLLHNLALSDENSTKKPNNQLRVGDWVRIAQKRTAFDNVPVSCLNIKRGLEHLGSQRKSMRSYL